MGDSADMGRLKLKRQRDPMLNKRLSKFDAAMKPTAESLAYARWKKANANAAKARTDRMDKVLANNGKDGNSWVSKLIFQTGMGIPRTIGSAINAVKDPVATAKGTATAIRHPVRTAKQTVKENPGDLLFGLILGGATAGPKAAVLNANRRAATVAKMTPEYNPFAQDLTRLRPTIPVRDKPGWNLERQLGTDTHRKPQFITYKGTPFPMGLHSGEQVAYNLVGPSPTKKKGRAVYGSITGEPNAPGRRTPLGEIYVSDQARAALGPFTGAESMVDAVWKAGNKRPIETLFANQQLGKFAKISEKRGKPWFKGVSDEEFGQMGANAGDVDETRWLHDPAGDPNDPQNWAFFQDDYIDMDTGELHPGVDPVMLPEPLYRALMGVNKPRDTTERGFGGTRGAGHIYLPDTILDEPPRQKALRAFLHRKR